MRKLAQKHMAGTTARYLDDSDSIHRVSVSEARAIFSPQELADGREMALDLQVHVEGSPIQDKVRGRAWGSNTVGNNPSNALGWFMYMQMIFDVRMKFQPRYMHLTSTGRQLTQAAQGYLRLGLQLVTREGPNGRPVARLVLRTPPGGRGVDPWEKQSHLQHPRYINGRKMAYTVTSAALWAMFGDQSQQPGFRVSADVQLQLDGTIVQVCKNV